MMSNAFAALGGDSDDEVSIQKIQIAKKKTEKKADHKKSVEKKVVDQKPTTSAPASVKKSGAGGGGANRPPRREHDRRSGTGRGKEGKKEGGGSHNWGRPGVDETAQPARAPKDEVVEEPIVEEESDHEMTFDEFEKTRVVKRDGAAFQEIAVRKGDGPSEGVAYTKKNVEEENFFQMGAKKEKRVRNKEQKKKMVETNFKVKESAPVYEPRAERGGRGGRGRGGGRGGFSSRGRGGPGIKLDDANAFPSLA